MRPDGRPMIDWWRWRMRSYWRQAERPGEQPQDIERDRRDVRAMARQMRVAVAHVVLGGDAA